MSRQEGFAELLIDDGDLALHAALCEDRGEVPMDNSFDPGSEVCKRLHGAELVRYHYLQLLIVLFELRRRGDVMKEGLVAVLQKSPEYQNWTKKMGHFLPTYSQCVERIRERVRIERETADACIICYTDEPNVVLVPCGHRFCESCLVGQFHGCASDAELRLGVSRRRPSLKHQGTRYHAPARFRCAKCRGDAIHFQFLKET